MLVHRVAVPSVAQFVEAVTLEVPAAMAEPHPGGCVREGAVGFAPRLAPKQAPGLTEIQLTSDGGIV
jgi:hypothetical protein